MICNVYTFSRSYCESKTQGGPSVVEVLRSPPRESIRPRGVDPESVEACGSAAVGEDVKESQKLGVCGFVLLYRRIESGEKPQSVTLTMSLAAPVRPSSSKDCSNSPPTTTAGSRRDVSPPEIRN